MTGLVCALSPERLRIVLEEPAIVHDIADRRVEVPGRVFFDALRLPSRVRKAFSPAPSLAALLDAGIGRGVGEKSGWAYGRPRIVDGDALAQLAAELEALDLDVIYDAARRDDADPIALEIASRDDAWIDEVRAMARAERARGGALLVHVT